MGSVVAILVAAGDERVRVLVAECPYATYDAIMTKGMRHYYHLPSFPLAPLAKWVIERRLGQALEVPEALDAVRAISPRPLFLIADERDAVVGPQETELIFEAAGEPKSFWLIAGADHACGWQAAPEEYERRVVAFLQEALAAEGGPVPAPYIEASGEGTAL